MTPTQWAQQSAISTANYLNNRDLTAQQTKTLQRGLETNERETRMVNNAILDQTAAMNRGLGEISRTNRAGFFQISRGLDSVSQDIHQIGSNMERGLQNLASEFQMGMTTLATQM